MRTRSMLALLVSLPIALSSLAAPPAAAAAAPIQVILDGRPLQLDPPPVIVEDRTLVPLRGLFEAMGATPVWDAASRSVDVTRGDRYVRLRIGRKLACLERTCMSAAVMDVPAQIRSDRTFVPLRFVSQSMGVRVSWDGARRAVLIETDKEPVPEAAPLRITSLLPYFTLTGPVPLQAEGAVGTAIQYYLMDPATGSGPMIASGVDPAAAYSYLPDPSHAGPRLVVAAIRDAAGAVRYAPPVPVTIRPDMTVRVTGAEPGSVVNGPVSFSSQVGFPATQVTFELTDPATGKTEKLGTAGQGDSVTWYPQMGHDGPRTLQAVAQARNGNSYLSAPLPFTLQAVPRQNLSGIREGDVISRPVTLQVSANYPLEAVQYLLDGRHLGWGTSYKWTFGLGTSGRHTLEVLVTGTGMETKRLGPVSFEADGRPQLWLTGLGPNQVVTGAITLKASANVPVSQIEYQLVDEQGNSVEVLGRKGPDESFSWSPGAVYAGQRRLRAVGLDLSGATVPGDVIPFRVFTGKLYPTHAVVPKDQFKDLAIRLSDPVYRETGLSAALQVAQAILETAWGQSAPVDKYTGQLSYNLFGIKGTGPAGSVTHNTWEEYNGVAYRVDDAFRAYHSVEESWGDHADFLLFRPRYAPVRAVMTDPVLGAWALRRSGYATDSQYPIKLINLMKTHDLFKLDMVEL